MGVWVYECMGVCGYRCWYDDCAKRPSMADIRNKLLKLSEVSSNIIITNM